MERTVFGRHRLALSARLKPLMAVTAADDPQSADGILLCGEASAHQILIVSGGCCLLQRFPAACIVSCGMSPRDSVSCSSISGNRASVSVMRELPVITGGRLDVQEICVPLRAPFSAELLAIAIAALLCAGHSPEEIVAQPF